MRKSYVLSLITLICLWGMEMRALEQKDGVYQIGTGEDLVAFAELVNGGNIRINAALTSDIDMIEEDAEFHPIASEANPYAGVFDGQGHTLRINIQTNQNFGALFAVTSNALIKNLILKGTIKTSASFAGGIIGYAWDSTTIENCETYVTIYSSVVGDGSIGGVIGVTNVGSSVKITNCLIGSMINGAKTTSCGGVCGWSSGGLYLTNCLLIGELNTMTDGCATFGRNSAYVSVTNCYYKDSFMETEDSGKGTKVTAAQLKSGEVCYLLNSDQSNLAFYQTLGQDEHPVLDSSHEIVVKNADGTYANYTPPIEISTPNDMIAYAALVNSGTKKDAVLTADIDMSEYPSAEYILDNYTCTFDGQGHTLTVNIQTDQNFGALFRQTKGSALIKNLIVKGTIETSASFAGGIIGYAFDNTCLLNCETYVTINSSVEGDGSLGGVIGIVDGWGVVSVTNCLFGGSINGELTGSCGGICGWTGGSLSLTDCLLTGELNTDMSGCATFARNYNNVIVTNCYYKDGLIEVDDFGKGTKVTAEQIESGEVTYRLNGNKADGGWYQTLGVDMTPTPMATSKKVYADPSGGFRCDGMPMGDVTYTNTEVTVTIPVHEYEGGFCMYCGQIEEGFLSPVNGVYTLGTANELAWFIKNLNDNKSKSLNAILTDDIDMSDYSGSDFMIKEYSGTFDGNGHTLTINYQTDQNNAALFKYTRGNAMVKDLILKGTIETSGQFAGGIISLAHENTTIQNCITYVAIHSPIVGDCTHGGIVALIETGSSVKATNIMFAGSINGDQIKCCGGVCGWASGSLSLTNFLAIGDINTDLDGCATFCRNSGNVRYTNCYYKEGFIELEDFSKGNMVTEAEIYSGSVAYRLNNGETDPTKAVWRQNVISEYEPSTPTPTDRECGIVYQLPNGSYMAVYDNESMAEFRETFLSQEREYLEKVRANAGVIEAYESKLEELTDIEEYKTFWTEFANTRLAKQALTDNVNAYNSYFDLVAEVNAYLDENEVAGTASDLLRSYVTDYMDPDETFANGSAPYIEEELPLSTEDVRNETNYLKGLWDKAVEEDYTSGTDITLRLTNGNFSEGWKGWEGNGGEESGSSLNPAVRQVWNASMHRYQTITGLKNGIYELQLNGLFRPAGNDHNTNYAAYLYANSGEAQNWVPFMAISEGALPVSKAVDLENSYIANVNTWPYDNELQFDDNGDLFYVPNSVDGASYAFRSGRYQNRVLVNVTDGSLHIGVYVPGTGASNDWAPFGGTKLIYQGDLESETATASLNAVLEGMASRAQTLIAYKANAYEYLAYTGFSQAEKDELQACIDDIASVGSNAEKYALVERFSKTFQSIKNTKDAYKYMSQMSDIYLQTAGNLQDVGAISEDELAALVNACEVMDEGFESGAFTAEEAREMKMFEGLGLIPSQVNGIYQIGTAAEFAIFGEMVRNLNNALSAKQTADIEGINAYNMTISDFAGVYDGDFHSLTVNINTNQSFTAPFRSTKGNALIKNLILKGTIETSATFASGIIGYACDNTSIENCETYVNINSLINGDGSHGGIIGATDGTGPIKVTNTLFAGSINGEQTIACGGISGWNNAIITVNNCLLIGDINTKQDGCATFGRNSSNVSVTNSYYKDGFIEVDDYGKGTKVTAEQQTSGEVAFLLNEDQSEIAWYQTLGEDAFPVLDSSHGIVYTSSPRRCDGVIIGDKTFTNDASQAASTLPEHQYEDGVCAVCGRVPVENGIYQLGGYKAVLWFADYVNEGNTVVDAVLTADIDMSPIDAFPPIGRFSETGTQQPYAGTFDGQGHIIKNLTVNENSSWESGFFGRASGATIKNLGIVNAHITNSQGVRAGVMGGEIQLSNIYNCFTAGDLQVYTTYPQKCGFAGEAWNTYFFNCYTTHDEFTNLGHWNNCYWGNDAVEKAPTGELCYLLNGDQSVIVWYQNIDEDPFPIFDSTHNTVIKNEDGSYGNITGIDAVHSEEPQVYSGIYDLSGRRVERMGKGLYIINGKKVVK